MFEAVDKDGLLLCGETVIGRVLTGESPKSAVNVSGRFIPTPGFENYRPAFESAVKAACAVDVSSPSDYLQLWYEWQTACKAVEDLGLSYGERRVPIEALGIDSEWTVEFSVPLWWLATKGGWNEAPKSTSQ